MFCFHSERSEAFRPSVARVYGQLGNRSVQKKKTHPTNHQPPTNPTRLPMQIRPNFCHFFYPPLFFSPNFSIFLTLFFQFVNNFFFYPHFLFTPLFTFSNRSECLFFFTPTFFVQFVNDFFFYPHFLFTPLFTFSNNVYFFNVRYLSSTNSRTDYHQE